MMGKMIKKVFFVLCFPLLRVNNNIYTFLSGVAISLSTNLFSSICIDDIHYCNQWNLYLASLAFATVSAFLLFIATKLSGVQEFIRTCGRDYDFNSKKRIVEEATSGEYIKWVIRYFILFSLLIAGIILLAIKDF